jgi:hypothetical protein
MSLADYASGPFPVLAKLASLLRNSASAIFRFSALLHRAIEKSPVSDFARASPAILEHSPNDKRVAAVETDARGKRELLIRRRWAETGVRMWSARVHGAGDGPLNIQGSVELLPPKPGETVRRYDKLEFRLLGGQIVCEGVVVDPPKGTETSRQTIQPV